MNTGIIVGMVATTAAILLNYLNLFGFKDFSTEVKEGIKIKHWRITYYISWVIAIIPWVGFIVECLWTSYLAFRPGYKCVNELFTEI